MNGAREYARLFTKAKQYGRLYVLPGDHARGLTFRIYILPEGEKVISNSPNAPLNKNIVEVYGVISGNLGWTECYGWLHKGKWQEDFKVLIKQQKVKQVKVNKNIKRREEQTKQSEKLKISKLLEKY